MFCTNRSIHAVVSSPLAPAAPPESVMLFLIASCKLSMTHSIVCHVLFQRDQLVLAYLTEQLQQKMLAQFETAQSTQQQSHLKRRSSMWRFWADFHKRYLTMSASDILAEDTMNSAISYSHLSELAWSCASSTTDDINSYTRDGVLKLTLKTAEIIKLTHQLAHSPDTYDTLSRLFGPKLRYTTSE